MAKIKVGDIFTTNQGYSVTVTCYEDAYNVVVEFKEPFTFTRKVRSGDLRKGKVDNPYAKDNFGVGFYGVGKYSGTNSGDRRCKSTWYHMLERCYDLRIKDTRYPAYEGCYVNESWHNFQNFAEFYYNDKYRKEGWVLDKDLAKYGNKEYGPTYCSFIPIELNNILLNSNQKERDLPVGVIKVSERVNKSKPYFANVKNRGQAICGYFADPLEAFAFYKENKERIVRERAMEYAGFVDDRIIENLLSWEISSGF